MHWQSINRYTEKNYLVWDRFAFLGVFLLVICGISITWNLEQHMDVLFWDEALYLQRGVALFDHIPKTWGPSYSLWYKFLSVFISDKVTLYYFNFKLTTIFISIGFFVALLSSGVNRLLSFILSLFFLSSYINLPVWPRVSHFCVIVLLTGIIVAKYKKTLLPKLIWISFSFLICAYARPELFIAFLISFVLVLIIAFYFRKEHSMEEWIIFGVLLLGCLFIYIFLKTPFNNGDSGRGLRVFLQHYAWGYNERHHLDNIFWLDFPNLIQQQFKDATTLQEILMTNPAEFFQHILHNFSNYFIELGKIIFSFFTCIFPKYDSSMVWIGCILLWIIYFLSARMSANKYIRLKYIFRENIFTLFMLLILAIPSVVACLYAYPRQHYLVLQVPLLLWLIALLISSCSEEIQNPIQNMIFIVSIWLFISPAAKDFKFFDLFRKQKSLCNLTTLRYIQHEIKTTDSVRVFDVEGYMTNLLSPNFINYNEIYYRNRYLLISDIIKKNNIDIVYVTPTLSQLYNIQKDTALFNMLKYPEQYGFIEQKTGNFTPFLLIKKKQ